MYTYIHVYIYMQLREQKSEIEGIKQELDIKYGIKGPRIETMEYMYTCIYTCIHTYMYTYTCSCVSKSQRSRE